VSFRRVADAAGLRPGEMKGLVVDTTRVLLVNVGGDVCAYEDSCPHRGVALSCGQLEASGTLTCAMHLWQYDARTGEGLNNPRSAALRRLPMKLEDGGIWVAVDGDAATVD
jgi:toluene monooxygenase system ferredoxin subunit